MPFNGRGEGLGTGRMLVESASLAHLKCDSAFFQKQGAKQRRADFSWKGCQGRKGTRTKKADNDQVLSTI